MKQALGTQWIVELHNCEPATLELVPHVEKAMLDAAREAQAHVVSHDFHQFTPFGVSGVVVLSESHITIHTWPEHGYAAVDIFFCSDDVDAEAAVRLLQDRFAAQRVDTRLLLRGRNYELAPALAGAEA